MSEQPAAAPAAPRSGLGTWGDHHLYSFVSSLGRVFRRPWATALTIGVMAVALALPLGLWLVLDNVSRLSGSVQQSREIGVFLQQESRCRRQALPTRAPAANRRGRAAPRTGA